MMKKPLQYSPISLTRREILTGAVTGITTFTAVGAMSKVMGCGFLKPLRAPEHEIRVGVSGFLAPYPEVLPVLAELQRTLDQRSAGAIRMVIDPASHARDHLPVLRGLYSGEHQMVLSSSSLTDPSGLTATMIGMLNYGLDSSAKAQWLMSEEGERLWAELYASKSLHSMYFGLGPNAFAQWANPDVWDGRLPRRARVASRCKIRNDWYRGEGFRIAPSLSAEQMGEALRTGRISLTEPMQQLLASSFRPSRELHYFTNDWSQSAPVFELVSKSDWLRGLPADTRQLLRTSIHESGEKLRARILARENVLQSRIGAEREVLQVPATAQLRQRLQARHREWFEAVQRFYPLAHRIAVSQNQLKMRIAAEPLLNRSVAG